MSNQLWNIWFSWGVLIHFWIFIEIVHIVTHPKEFLLIVRACQQNRCNSDYLGLGYFGNIWGTSLILFNELQTYFKHKFHLTCLETVHISFFKNLVIMGIRCLPNVDDLPCKSYIKRKLPYFYEILTIFEILLWFKEYLKA